MIDKIVFSVAIGWLPSLLIILAILVIVDVVT